MALKNVEKGQRMNYVAHDLAMEITVGGDRFDRDDLFGLLRGAGAGVEDMDFLRRQTLETAKDMQPDGYTEKSVAFFNRQLDYWLDPEAFQFSRTSVSDVEMFSDIVVQRVVNGQAEGYGPFDRPFFHQMLVSMGVVSDDMARIFDTAKEKALAFHDGVESLEDFNGRVGRSLAWWLDKKVFDESRSSLLGDAGGDMKVVPASKDKKVVRKKEAGLSM